MSNCGDAGERESGVPQPQVCPGVVRAPQRAAACGNRSTPGASTGNAVAWPHAAPRTARSRGRVDSGRAHVPGLRQGMGLERLEGHGDRRDQDRHLCPEDSTEAAAPGLYLPTGKGGRRPGPGEAVSPIWSLRLGERPGGEVWPASSAAFGLPCAGPARARHCARHVGGRPATVPAPDRSTMRSPGACRKRRSFTATKRGGRELGEEDGGNARAWAARAADAVRILAVTQRGSRP